MYSSRRRSRDYLLPTSAWSYEGNNNHPHPLTTSHSTSSMLRSCSNFIHRFSSRLKIQANDNETTTRFNPIPEFQREKSREREIPSKPLGLTTSRTLDFSTLNGKSHLALPKRVRSRACGFSSRPLFFTRDALAYIRN